MAISHTALYGEESREIPLNAYYNEYFKKSLGDIHIAETGLDIYTKLPVNKTRIIREKAIQILLELKPESFEYDSSIQRSRLEWLESLVDYIYTRGSLVCEEISGDKQSINKIGELMQSIEEFGYGIVDSFLNKEEVQILRHELKEIAQREVDDKTAYIYGKSMRLQRVYNLFQKSYMTQNIFSSKTVRAILESFYDRETLHDLYFLSSIQANILKPGAEDQNWHIDNNLEEPIPARKMRININVIVDEFTQENGPTEIIAGSHKSGVKPKGNRIYKGKKLLAPAGSLIIWDGSVWHRSTANKTCHSRYAILGCYCSSIYRELSMEENYCRVFAKEELQKTSPYLQGIMGFNHGIK